MIAAKHAPVIDPYCSNCGYILSGLADSSKCPECGRPIVEVLTRAPRFLESGKRYRSAATLFGLPVVDIAMGPKHGQLRGSARGIIAIGDVATGWLALGGVARGIVALGGVAIGLFSLGGCSIGLLSAVGGCAIGAGMSVGGVAIGTLAIGGAAIGFAAQGGTAIGWYARGASAVGQYTINLAGANSPAASSFFEQLSWFFRTWPLRPVTMLQPAALASAASCAAGLLICAIAALAARTTPDESNQRPA